MGNHGMDHSPGDRLIVALDGMAPEQALAFAAALPGLRWAKVGLEFFVAGGSAVVQQLRDPGKRVFLGLKFHDIPATVAGASARRAQRDAAMLVGGATATAEEEPEASLAAVHVSARVSICPVPWFCVPAAARPGARFRAAV